MDPARAARLHDAIDRQFAEAFTIMPKIATANGRPRADSARPTTSLVGVFTNAVVSANPKAPGRSGHYAPQVDAAEPTVTFSADQLPFAAAKTDVIRREATGDLFSVYVPVPNGFGRVTLRLIAKPGS